MVEDSPGVPASASLATDRLRWNARGAEGSRTAAGTPFRVSADRGSGDGGGMAHEQMEETATTCGCASGNGEGGERTAIHVDAAIKDRNIKRLRRIEGQIRGLQRMVEEERYCADIM